MNHLGRKSLRPVKSYENPNLEQSGYTPPKVGRVRVFPATDFTERREQKAEIAEVNRQNHAAKNIARIVKNNMASNKAYGNPADIEAARLKRHKYPPISTEELNSRFTTQLPENIVENRPIPEQMRQLEATEFNQLEPYQGVGEYDPQFNDSEDALRAFFEANRDMIMGRLRQVHPEAAFIHQRPQRIFNNSDRVEEIDGDTGHDNLSDILDNIDLSDHQIMSEDDILNKDYVQLFSDEKKKAKNGKKFRRFVNGIIDNARRNYADDVRQKNAERERELEVNQIIGKPWKKLRNKMLANETPGHHAEAKAMYKNLINNERANLRRTGESEYLSRKYGNS
jgi:hypothetical protein